MADETQQMNLLPEGAEMPAGEVPVAPPGGAVPEPGIEEAAPEEEGFDIDSLLSQIDAAQMSPESAAVAEPDDGSAKFSISNSFGVNPFCFTRSISVKRILMPSFISSSFS